MFRHFAPLDDSDETKFHRNCIICDEIAVVTIAFGNEKLFYICQNKPCLAIADSVQNELEFYEKLMKIEQKKMVKSSAKLDEYQSLVYEISCKDVPALSNGDHLPAGTYIIGHAKDVLMDEFKKTLFKSRFPLKEGIHIFHGHWFFIYMKKAAFEQRPVLSGIFPMGMCIKFDGVEGTSNLNQRNVHTFEKPAFVTMSNTLIYATPGLNGEGVKIQRSDY